MNWPIYSRRTTKLVLKGSQPLCNGRTVKERAFVLDANVRHWDLSAFNNLMQICVIGT